MQANGQGGNLLAIMVDGLQIYEPLRLSVAQRWRYERHGVPRGRRPLAQAPLSICLASGLDVDPGQLVLTQAGRWALVYLDIRAAA